MRQHRKRLVAALVATTALAGGSLTWSGAAVGTAAGADTTNRGIERLKADATDGLSIERGVDGVADFVGTSSGNRVVNPNVSRTMSVRDAARAHLARYGAALGLADGADLVATRTTRATSGQDVVRFQQEIDSAPVIGGQVVVSLRGDRQLGSMLATTSDARSLPAPTVAQDAASETAAGAAARASGATGLTTTAQGRAVWDPSIFGALGTAQGVWKFEVGDGVAVRRLVLVDDTSGRVVLDLDQIHHLDRVVCDRNNVRGNPTPCTSGFARTETGPASAVADVNAAFDNAGAVSTAYQQIAGLDLTQALGVSVGGVKKLAATVRYCPPTAADGGCPYANAFWNGTQMFYGNGFAVADDVVGHEMTHGVIDQYSELFYWGQSGAMNESIADIMGEIVDHRTGADDDSQWKLSEDLSIGAIRDMKDPTSKGDPDKMTSPLYTADLAQWNTYGAYPDGGGVHQNSGVGNKTAYLISQGGTFNNQTITGIDGADAGLTKTGKLYFDAITRLTSGSDYANLASVLEQSCADFVTSGTGGFTTTDCDNIKKAVLATELRTTPTNAPQPADAVKACPTGTTMRELFNSETGNPGSKFTSSVAGEWGYGVNADWGSNATSGLTSWFGYNPDGSPASASLTATAGTALPAGQKSYLSFNQWRVFEWYPAGLVQASTLYVDGGTVEVNGADTAALPWTNGPQQVLASYPGTTNQFAGRKAFAGDSFGWTTTQLDLSSFAGQSVTPSFTTRGDASDGFIGWFLDDITVYTCDVPAPPTTTPTSPVPTTTPTTPVPTTTPTTPPATKAASTTKLTVRTGSAKVTVKAVIKAVGAKATGKVRFTVTGKKNVTKTVKVKKGKATLVLTGKLLDKLGTGKHTVKATYQGSDTVARSKARSSFNLR